MSTSYQKVYEKFTQKISDYMFDGMLQSEAEEYFLGYLKNAIPKFIQCEKDLTQRDDTIGEFIEDLTELEQEILAFMMVLEWVQPKINHADLLELRLGTKDFNTFSSANQLKELKELKKEIQKEINDLIILYSYNKSLEELS